MILVDYKQWYDKFNLLKDTDEEKMKKIPLISIKIQLKIYKIVLKKKIKYVIMIYKFF